MKECDCLLGYMVDVDYNTDLHESNYRVYITTEQKLRIEENYGLALSVVLFNYCPLCGTKINSEIKQDINNLIGV